MIFNLVAAVMMAVLGIQSALQEPGSQVQDHASQVQPSTNQLRITHGPVVENVTDTAAVIAWSTNVNAGTVLHYGVEPDHLDRTATMPWGGLTHRVELSNLQPGTKYFFRAESPQGQGTGESANGPVLWFQTTTAK